MSSQVLSLDDDPRGPSRRKRLLLAGTLLLCFLSGAVVGLLLLAKFGSFPSIESVQEYRPSVSSKIYDRYNKVVGEIYLEKRTVVPYQQIPPHVVNAFVSAEDANFFKHRGVDLTAIARAALKDLLGARFAQGGSTITQQTVKNLFLTHEKSIRRKLKELILAYRMESKMSKEEILFLYLNQIFLGEGAYGVEAASRAYFGKGVAELNLAEGALLAGLPKAPNRYSPRTNPELAKGRQRYVLRRMVEAGFLNQEESDKAYAAKIVLAPPSTFRSKAAYFLEEVRVYLTEKYGTESLYRDGLRIYTTIDPRLQEAAHDVLIEGVKRTEERNKYEGLQGAILALDPHNGAILAMVGGIDFAASQFNRSLQARRQPGSAFKPIVYTAAISGGRTVVSMTDDSPVEFDRNEEEIWKPRNYDGKFLGPIPLIEALAQSRNLATIRLLNEVGVESALRTAKALGIESPIERNLSIALGSSGVSLLEMCNAYATLANRGIRPKPFFLREVRDVRGNVLERTTPSAEPAIPPDTAYLMVRMMQEVILNGTGKAAKGLGRYLAGKTGTTNENTDAWFLGFSPDLVAGVWIGFDNPRPLGDRESAAVVALPIWSRFMGRVLPLYPNRDFPVPPGITFARVDPEAGKALPPGSSGGVLLPFRVGTVPEAISAGGRTGAPRPPADDLL
ncbi:MAG TPA: PBP1A family penicillin-binding protein [Candidatus Deferrimicrobiaceae bacterium]|nr:PBP1A family penicillin-binding protein [Candidatus Deferrimicrobiaceae bacterium]